MKLQLISTPNLTDFSIGSIKTRVRVWEGQTDDGIPVKAYVVAVSPQTHDADANAKFERELVELKKESSFQAIDLRFIL